MKTSFSNNLCRLPALLLTGLICGGLGWWLHGLTGQKMTGTVATPMMESRFSTPMATTQSPAWQPLVQSQAGSTESPAESQKRINAVMERISITPSSDIVEIMEAIGALTRMTDAEIKVAWNELSQQIPSMSFGNGLRALYLWGRMQRMGEKVAVPTGWGAENFGDAIASENARHDRTNLLTRLKAGDALSDTERRVIFTEAMREDPLRAIQLWCSTTKPADYERDAKWMGDALTTPETRAAIMAQVRTWQAGGDLANVVSTLTRNWVSRDPAAVEQWLKQPEQADVKDVVMNDVIAARAMANPADTWEWSQSLSGQQRLDALEVSANQLANRGPEGVEAGMELIAELQNPDERQEAIKGFARNLAANDFDQWQQWRDTLPPAEQDVANESSFALWANNDIDKAVEWLNDLPAGESKDNLVAVLVSHYAEKDPQTAAQWVRSISDPSRRRIAASVALSDIGPYDLDRVRIILNAAGN